MSRSFFYISHFFSTASPFRIFPAVSQDRADLPSPDSHDIPSLSPFVSPFPVISVRGEEKGGLFFSPGKSSFLRKSRGKERRNTHPSRKGKNRKSGKKQWRSQKAEQMEERKTKWKMERNGSGKEETNVQKGNRETAQEAGNFFQKGKM